MVAKYIEDEMHEHIVEYYAKYGRAPGCVLVTEHAYHYLWHTHQRNKPTYERPSVIHTANDTLEFISFIGSIPIYRVPGIKQIMLGDSLLA